jgi:hypothetical protein
LVEYAPTPCLSWSRSLPSPSDFRALFVAFSGVVSQD